jgi:hypothetical protein
MTEYESLVIAAMAEQNRLLAEQNQLMTEQNQLIGQRTALMNRIGLTLGQTNKQLGELNAIAGFMALACTNKTVCRFTEPLSAYKTFDWVALGAEVVREDRSGPMIVRWSGATYTRRTYAKNGPDIWFSRLIGTPAGGDKSIYEILIKFSTSHDEAEQVPESIMQAAGLK